MDGYMGNGNGHRDVAGDLPEFRRMRRLRRNEATRRFVRETALDPGDFIYPLFVTFGSGVRKPIGSMPGQFQLSVDQLAAEMEELHGLGIGSVLLFGIPEEKDREGSGAHDRHGPVQEAVREIKRVAPEMLVITDVCACEYTDHGHCGILSGCHIDNDLTLELLAKVAVSHAEAGSDVIAPSDMMDGRVAAIRRALDRAGHAELPILSYAAKYASSFYGPFRDAVGSKGSLGKSNKYNYQMDPANSNEALREIALDIQEGADMIMIKPGLPYLDIVWRAKQTFGVPTFVYHVSGEYAMLKAAAANGWLDEKAAALEALLSMKRAGADGILTYYALEAAEWLRLGK